MSTESEAKIIIDGKEFTCPVLTGTENEKAIDIRKLRSETGYITFDEGYGNTGSCKSNRKKNAKCNGKRCYKSPPFIA